jgi:hypothetical protein
MNVDVTSCSIFAFHCDLQQREDNEWILTEVANRRQGAAKSDVHSASGYCNSVLDTRISLNPILNLQPHATNRRQNE